MNSNTSDTKHESEFLVCFKCGQRKALRMMVVGGEGTEEDGRRFAFIKERINCTACYTEQKRAIKIVASIVYDPLENIGEVIGTPE